MFLFNFNSNSEHGARMANYHGLVALVSQVALLAQTGPNVSVYLQGSKLVADDLFQQNTLGSVQRFRAR